MPQGIATTTSPYFNRHSVIAPEAHPSDRLRLSTWLHRGALDARLARGTELHGDERLALRAEQLVSRSERDRLARSLERMLELAGHPTESKTVRTAPVLSSRVPLQATEIRACAGDFDALVSRLRGDEPIDAQGVVMARRLISDGASPLYYRRNPVTLRHAVRSARLALEPVSAPVPVEMPLAA